MDDVFIVVDPVDLVDLPLVVPGDVSAAYRELKAAQAEPHMDQMTPVAVEPTCTAGMSKAALTAHEQYLALKELQIVRLLDEAQPDR